MAPTLAEILPWVGVILGSGVLSALVTALVSRRTAREDTFTKRTQALLDGYAKERELSAAEREKDRIHRAELNAKVDTVITLYHAEQRFSNAVMQWGLAGAPPPPPKREDYK